MRPYFSLAIPDLVRAELLAHAEAERPLECCGILAGAAGIVTKRFPIRNDLASPTEYLTNARDLLDAMRTMRGEGLETMAIYHSHPAGDAVPSRTDLERNTWGESVVHLIVGKDAIRAWWLLADRFDEAPIVWRPPAGLER